MNLLYILLGGWMTLVPLCTYTDLQILTAGYGLQ